jgi:Glycine zipper
MRMRHSEVSILAMVMGICIAVLSIGGLADAQKSAGGSISASLGVVPYPSKGQSPSQQDRDEGECYAWAKKQTGIDPMATASAPAPSSGAAVGGGERVRGAARGAAGGAAIGAIAGDAGKGAGVGAVVGTMAGGRQARQNKAAKQQQAEQAKAQTLQTFNRAFGACMEGRGYVVK